MFRYLSYVCLPVKKLLILSSKNKSTMSSPNCMKTAALRIFWRPHFDINRKFTAICLLTKKTKCTGALWGGAKADSFLGEGSTSLRNCSFIPNVWEQTLPGKCSLHLLHHRLAQQSIRSTSFTPLPKPKCGIKEVGISAHES